MLTKAVSSFKRVYRYAALLALINGAALIGLTGYLILTGVLRPASIQRAIAALRGEPVEAQEPSAAQTTIAIAMEEEAGPQVDNLAVKAQMDIEILHREAERVKVELAQRLALNNSILVQVENERDAFRRELELEKRRQEEAAKQVRDVGFDKQVEIFQSLSPKVAVQHLLAMSDPDEAARILTAVDPDRARKIIEAARKEPELSQMQMILQKVREVKPIPGVAQGGERETP